MFNYFRHREYNYLTIGTDVVCEEVREVHFILKIEEKIGKKLFDKDHCIQSTIINN